MDLKKGLDASAQKTLEAVGEAFVVFLFEFFSLCVLCIRACCFLRRNPPALFSFIYLKLKAQRTDNVPFRRHKGVLELKER